VDARAVDRHIVGVVVERGAVGRDRLIEVDEHLDRVRKRLDRRGGCADVRQRADRGMGYEPARSPPAGPVDGPVAPVAPVPPRGTIACPCAWTPLVIGALAANVINPTVLDAHGPTNVVREEATATLRCVLLPGVTGQDLETELRVALGDGDDTLDVSEPEGGLTSPTGTPLHHAIEQFLAEHDPEARLAPTLGYGYSDCHTLRDAYGTIAYGFIPFRHADPMTNLTTKHGVDEHVLIDDVVFQTQAAIHVARAIGTIARETPAAA
jgi:acetylornithine deacetylase/succinyl-diaminopimelate desuccinylase-like protein